MFVCFSFSISRSFAGATILPCLIYCRHTIRHHWEWRWTTIISREEEEEKTEDEKNNYYSRFSLFLASYPSPAQFKSEKINSIYIFIVSVDSMQLRYTLCAECERQNWSDVDMVCQCASVHWSHVRRTNEPLCWARDDCGTGNRICVYIWWLELDNVSDGSIRFGSVVWTLKIEHGARINRTLKVSLRVYKVLRIFTLCMRRWEHTRSKINAIDTHVLTLTYTHIIFWMLIFADSICLNYY